MTRVLVVDNYDSFVYNLVQYLGELGATVEVHRNDRLSVDDVAALGPDAILLSPGPGRPEGAGITPAVIERFAGQVPILGVCLGHQAIGQAFGGSVVRAPELRHGKTSPVHHDGAGVMADMPRPFQATRYHSLVVEREGLPDVLEVTAWTEDDVHGPGLVMGLRHRELDVEGVQFHPESILTESGRRLLATWLARAGHASPAGVVAKVAGG